MHGASRQALKSVRERLTTLADEIDAPAMSALGEGMLSVVRLLDREGSLRRTLGDPALDASAKERLVDGLLADQLDSGALALLKDVVAERWSSARALVDAVEVLGVTAVFHVAESAGELDEVEDELFRFARTLSREPELRAVLTDRGLDTDRKQALIDELLDGKVKTGTKRIVQALVITPRGRTLEVGLEEYAGLAADIRSRTLATVTTAIPLDDSQRDRLTTSLSAQLGRQVQIQSEVDPRVVGGVLIRLGDEVIDGSTKHRLAEARRRLS